MTLNIEHWKVKELDGLRIPVDALGSIPEIEYACSNVEDDEEAVWLSAYGLAEGFELSGKWEVESVLVSHLQYWGEFSGTHFDELKGLLRRSTGRLRVKMIWESGDEEILTVDDGEVTVEEAP